MEFPLKLICNVNDLQLQQRYSLSEFLTPDLVFTVVEENDTHFTLRYDDNVIGIVYKNSPHFTCFEYPYSPLELELL